MNVKIDFNRKDLIARSADPELSITNTLSTLPHPPTHWINLQPGTKSLIHHKCYLHTVSTPCSTPCLELHPDILVSAPKHVRICGKISAKTKKIDLICTRHGICLRFADRCDKDATKTKARSGTYP
jgi:hypothetical protein